jgi:hypothetical protein
MEKWKRKQEAIVLAAIFTKANVSYASFAKRIVWAVKNAIFSQ